MYANDFKNKTEKWEYFGMHCQDFPQGYATIDVPVWLLMREVKQKKGVNLS
jgi:hypothetical protein